MVRALGREGCRQKICQWARDHGGGITAWFAQDFGHHAVADLGIHSHGERDDESSAMAQAVEPNRLRMRGAAIYEHGVAGAGVECRSISLVDGYVRVAREIFFGTSGEIGLEFQCDDAAAWASDFRDDGCVITDAAAEMKCAVARLKRERVDPARQGAGLAAIEMRGHAQFPSKQTAQMRSWLAELSNRRPEVYPTVNDLCTTCVQEGGFEGPENGPKQRRINNRLLSYRPKSKDNFEILTGG